MQIVFSCLVILGVLMGIVVTRDLYLQVRDGYDPRRQKNIFTRGKLAALTLLIATTYFTFLAYSAYQKQKNRTNLMFLIATELAWIAVMIRYLNIRESDIENVQDVI